MALSRQVFVNSAEVSSTHTSSDGSIEQQVLDVRVSPNLVHNQCCARSSKMELHCKDASECDLVHGLDGDWKRADGFPASKSAQLHS